jgi:hypothetical protein
MSQEDINGITAAIHATTHDRIVVISKSSQPDGAGVRTASGPTAGCQYFVRRVAGTWKIMGENCWTHVMPRYQRSEERWSPVTRPWEISKSDFDAIKAVVARQTRDDIRTIKVTTRAPLTVQVHTASSHIVTEGDFTLQKVGDDWQITKRDQLIH